MSTATKDFYKTLGVSEKANQGTIKKAYRKLAKKYHPDANPGGAKVHGRFKGVGEAYGVLSDPEKRKQYDKMRRLSSFGFGRMRQAPRGKAGQPSGGGFSVEDLQGFGGLGDIFNSIFDRESRSPGQDKSRGPLKGQSVEYPVEISFRTAVRGGKIPINVPITEECVTCGGSGAMPRTKTRGCMECKGSGAISFGQGGFAVNRPCPACLGRGLVPEVPCRSCGGSGTVRQTRSMKVTVPKGVETGSKLRISGGGERGAQGGKPGDLIITFKVQSHEFFRREGLDIHVMVPINLAQATLGSKMGVKTVDGKKVHLRIPPGTQSGTKFHIKGQGIQKDGRVGDQYVEVTVDIPETLTDEQRRRMEDFAVSSGLEH
ncbi:MAG: molecular chaperone DnaJ [Gemmatimonadota bacterium]|nr:molecular chaperone DnaJ [Gemmatimonadota bacterium]